MDTKPAQLNSLLEQRNQIYQRLNDLAQEKNKLSESDKKKIKKLLKKLSIKDITKIFVEEKNVSKKEVYNYCLYLKNEN